MINILLACRRKASLSPLDDGLAAHGVNITWTDSGTKGLSVVAGKSLDLVVSDEDLEDMKGLEFIRRVILKNPMVNCALVSSLSPDVFHEASEGLGILMQLPVKPGPEHAEKLLLHLNSILNTLPVW
jgi:CheY-like chemotaxis protein